MESNQAWLIYYYIATYILAIVALVGLYLSIKSSKNVGNALQFIQQGLISLSEPLFTSFGASFTTNEAKIHFTNKGATAQKMSVVPKGNFSAKIYNDILDTNERGQIDLTQYPAPVPEQFIFQLLYENKIGNTRSKTFSISTSSGRIVEEQEQ